MRVYLHTFGCKANQYDTEVVRQALEDNGATVVDDPALADAAVVNSCTVTHTGEAKMRSLVRRIARQAPAVNTVVMGCAAALDDGSIAALPGVSRVVSGSDPASVMRTLGYAPEVETRLRSFARGSRAWVRIQDGCDEHCTFCATTLARGANRSRDVAEILDEVRLLAESNEEVVLTGIHIGTYGRDLAAPVSLSELCRRIIEDVPGIRVRLSSIEATEIDELLAELLIDSGGRLAPHVHAPLQSGSDRLLKRMGRHWYTSRTYHDRLQWLAARLPVFGLGADVIVGFPGETDADFALTRDLIEQLPFTYLHVFPYSERPDAPAQKLGRPVDPQVVRERAATLREIASLKARTYRVARSGGRADTVLINRRSGKLEGMTGDFLSVYLDSESLPASRRFEARLELRGSEMWATAVNTAPGPA